MAWQAERSVDAEVGQLRVLVVSYYFPPAGASGSVRIGKTVLTLLAMGHDVRVLTARDVPLPQSMPMPIPESRIDRTDWYDVNRWALRASGGRDAFVASGTPTRGVKASLARLYRTVVIPDPAIGWVPHAVRAARSPMGGDWRPDVIWASYRPATSLLAAQRVARHLNCPWVADFRDLWAANPYAEFPGWRRKLERGLERRVLSSASLLTTVSEPLAGELRRTYQQQVVTVMNGCDLEDAEGIDTSPTRPSEPLLIRHLGTIYPGKRDPRQLFAAIAGDRRLRAGIRLEFVGRLVGDIPQLVREFDLEDVVSVRSSVTREQSLQLQRDADALLLLTWNNTADDGALPGKLFEYIASRRAVLNFGNTEGAAAALLAENTLGISVDAAAEVSRVLHRWLDRRDSGRSLMALGEVPHHLTRQGQTEVLVRALGQAVAEGRRVARTHRSG